MAVILKRKQPHPDGCAWTADAGAATARQAGINPPSHAAPRRRKLSTIAGLPVGGMPGSARYPQPGAIPLAHSVPWREVWRIIGVAAPVTVWHAATSGTAAPLATPRLNGLLGGVGLKHGHPAQLSRRPASNYP